MHVKKSLIDRTSQGHWVNKESSTCMRMQDSIQVSCSHPVRVGG
jgi:hypothetical protein